MKISLQLKLNLRPTKGGFAITTLSKNDMKMEFGVILDQLMKDRVEQASPK